MEFVWRNKGTYYSLKNLLSICANINQTKWLLAITDLLISQWLYHPNFKLLAWLALDRQEMVQKCYIKKNRSLVKEWDALSGNRDVRLDTGQEVSRQWAIEKGTQKERPRVSAPGWTSLTQNSLSCYCASQCFRSFSGETGGLFIPATCGVKACSRFGWKLAQQRWPTFTFSSSSKLKYYTTLRDTHLISLALLKHFRLWCGVLNVERSQRSGNTGLT